MAANADISHSEAYGNRLTARIDLVNCWKSAGSGFASVLYKGTIVDEENNVSSQGLPTYVNGRGVPLCN